jgi:N-formylglutamate deformylase
MRYSMATPTFVVSPPAPDRAAPVVFDSPHSGMEWPEDFQPAASREAILTTWDAFVDELWADAPAGGATLVAARFPRAYIDVNRAADDIDPALLDGPWPAPLATTDYSRRGMGLIRRLALPGVPMYDRPLRVEEVAARLQDYYRPYRKELASRLDDLHREFGEVWHINCHSMKSRGNGMNVDEGALRPDIVVSDRQGRTADPEFTRWAAEYFSGRGFSVKINDPYRGGDLVGTHGDPPRHRQSIQIEINRALYMDETAFVRGPRFAEIRAELTGFVRAVVGRILNAAS